MAGFRMLFRKDFADFIPVAVNILMKRLKSMAPQKAVGWDLKECSVVILGMTAVMIRYHKHKKGGELWKLFYLYAQNADIV
jgi:hypothetical protein